jgi:hypothetical protein
MKNNWVIEISYKNLGHGNVMEFQLIFRVGTLTFVSSFVGVIIGDERIVCVKMAIC